MSGLLSGLTNFLYGQAPGASFDPSEYLAKMDALNNQIGSLYSNAPQADILNSPGFSQIQSMLAPGANGQLSSPLMAMYNSGATQNNMNAGAAGAMALSGIQGRNLEGSSLSNQALENAGMQGTMANSGLLAALYGLQDQNTSQLAGLLNSGGQFDISQNNNMLNAHAAALAGIAQGYGGLAKFGMGENNAAQMAQYQNNGQLTNSLISATLGKMLSPGGGGGGGGSIPTPGAMSFAGGDSGMGFGGTAGMGSGAYAMA